MDVLSEVLHAVRLEGAVFFNAEFSAPWGMRSPAACEMAPHLGRRDRHLVIYHLLTEGRGTASLEGSPQLDLVAGDVVVFPHGDPHVLANGSPARLVEIARHLPKVLSRSLTPARMGGGGEVTRFVCGYMACDRELSRSFLGGLPPVFKVNIRHDDAGRWLEESIRFSAREAAAGRAGGEAVLAKLSEALFVETLRRYTAELPPGRTGWLAGARDPQVGEALSQLHRAPERPWTIAALASSVGVSRSVLAERFRRFLGEPPMTYLFRWRLRLGAQMLGSTAYSVARIAGDVGYESEPAFNRAFKREFGSPPARFRQQVRAARQASRQERDARSAP